MNDVRNKMKKNDIKEWINNNKEFIPEIVVLIPIILFIYFTTYYWDNQTVFVSVLANIDRVFSGQWYQIFNGWSLPYGILWQVICAIWVLPVWICGKIGLFTWSSVHARIWYKLFILCAMLLDAKILGDISRRLHFNDKKEKWLKLFFLSSIIVLTSALHIGQLDAVYLAAILLGIDGYLQNNNRRFLIWFAFAIPAKYFALFLFIPLVLLKEKRYLYIIRDFCVGGSLIVIDKIWKRIGYFFECRIKMSAVPGQGEVSNVNQAVEEITVDYGGDFVQGSISSFLNGDIEIFHTPLPLVVLLLGLLCVWCFVQTVDDNDKLNDLAISVCYWSLLILFAFGICSPYWLILIMPFQIILAMRNSELIPITIPLDIAIGVAYIYVYTFDVPWIIGSCEIFDNLLISLIPGYTEQIHGYIKDYLSIHGGFKTLFGAVWTVGAFGIGYVTLPFRKQQPLNGVDKGIYCKLWYWIRIILLYGWIALNIKVVMLNQMWN